MMPGRFANTMRDVVGIAGIAMLSFGAWLAWPPAGFMVAGTILLAAAVASVRR
jgi:ABC-type protease/lipase transport system fused ATPase/permease subunit